ncbi:hypothetical protein [Salinisphaera sp.]|uniref:hypothetical protein n=1 Tax=Salinisphaera sp. TaxID=1914330 RepID=UPI002D7A02D4|nr:hypothetical protein [Salinisphaera sp.]HET7315283.1 hypothetical protein [Salinisphaera sp.]
MAAALRVVAPWNARLSGEMPPQAALVRYQRQFGYGFDMVLLPFYTTARRRPAERRPMRCAA